MAHVPEILTLAALLCGSPPSAPPDLSGVDRAVVREPVYRTSPRYCLLVFGPAADVRVWLVRDGERLYVDRNANGDLTEPGESVGPSDRSEFSTIFNGKAAPYRTWRYAAGDLAPTGRRERHAGLELTQYQIGDEPAEVVLSVLVHGTTKQYAGWAPLFAGSRERAPVVHFGGPMVVQTLRGTGVLSLATASPELHLRFGTPGLGEHTFASLAYEAVPADVRPLAEIEWPAAGPGNPPIRTTVVLKERC